MNKVMKLNWDGDYMYIISFAMSYQITVLILPSDSWASCSFYPVQLQGKKGAENLIYKSTSNSKLIFLPIVLAGYKFFVLAIQCTSFKKETSIYAYFHVTSHRIVPLLVHRFYIK